MSFEVTVSLRQKIFDEASLIVSDDVGTYKRDEVIASIRQIVDRLEFKRSPRDYVVSWFEIRRILRAACDPSIEDVAVDYIHKFLEDHG